MARAKYRHALGCPRIRHPRGHGKIGSFHGSLKEECVGVTPMATREAARNPIARYVKDDTSLGYPIAPSHGDADPPCPGANPFRPIHR
uniref:Uncharacterized protein n=1 Tax=Candidatus Kentrum eta TaxID=2126337 RepID=A0A450UHU7_9GAMM|nr:MAG: hypothetical protein BECKH772A_GA0070896_1002516 [Candidatus Kentron sp. H]VFJ92122.1 MAG: hypothetical protein BECKH772B_GA0070898_1002515 [Candidatus Kentron sp. H]VFJ98704.1 MAG: hypothetical protein BECKH772C_GA0070978_1002416 [Candidatus Kentron sp. H]